MNYAVGNVPNPPLAARVGLRTASRTPIRLQRTIADMRAELTMSTRGLGNVTVVDGTADNTICMMTMRTAIRAR